MRIEGYPHMKAIHFIQVQGLQSGITAYQSLPKENSIC